LATGSLTSSLLNGSMKLTPEKTSSFATAPVMGALMPHI
jgi:hypothetical protein